jgi:hypothetical protein
LPSAPAICHLVMLNSISALHRVLRLGQRLQAASVGRHCDSLARVAHNSPSTRNRTRVQRRG